jgi:predicted CXXCH cytochrome family protein
MHFIRVPGTEKIPQIRFGPPFKRQRETIQARQTGRTIAVSPAPSYLPLFAAGCGHRQQLIVIAILLTALQTSSRAEESTSASRFVGSTACATCHTKEYAAWQGSQHRAAMQSADEKTVLGDFNAAHFSYAGVTSTFSRRGGKFMVSTDGPDGKLHDYEVRYTFGVDPLQQYLIELPGGRLQALSIAWDAKHRKWFHLYPKEGIGFSDELHWTRPAQNWNYMCADCHSTGLRKNYDAIANRFATSWSEISVGCEACHGPGSAHLTWANAPHEGKPYAGDGRGLAARLDERRGVTWTRDAASATATRSVLRRSEREIEVCAQCHARRGQFADGYVAGRAFLDYYRPALLTAPLYYPDGQQRDEVYNWGSFLQSKMYAAGVTCSDCHEPHGGTLRAQGNAVCAQCHAAGKFDATAHHHHRTDSPGAQCANCHMPTTTYMVIDPRHDHSLRIPRPDQSVQLGTPNACNACHGDRDARWAAAQVKNWYGHDPVGYQRYAQAFAAANTGAVGAGAQLRAIAGDRVQPAIARATALASLDANANSATLDVVASGLRDTDPLVRLGALDSLSGAPAELRLRYGLPLLSDPVRAVRMEAATSLADVPLTAASGEQRAAFERAAADYVQAQHFNADRADARTNLGSFEARRGATAQAEQDLQAAIALDPLFVPAYVNLADTYRAQGREADVERVLRDGLRQAPKSAVLHHVLGLALVREKRHAQALSELARAAALDPANARYAYVYGVALYSAGRANEGIAMLVSASSKHPADTDILAALASFYRDRGDEAEAQRYTERLRGVAAGL